MQKLAKETTVTYLSDGEWSYMDWFEGPNDDDRMEVITENLDDGTVRISLDAEGIIYTSYVTSHHLVEPKIKYLKERALIDLQDAIKDAACS